MLIIRLIDININRYLNGVVSLSLLTYETYELGTVKLTMAYKAYGAYETYKGDVCQT